MRASTIQPGLEPVNSFLTLTMLLQMRHSKSTHSITPDGQPVTPAVRCVCVTGGLGEAQRWTNRSAARPSGVRMGTDSDRPATDALAPAAIEAGVDNRAAAREDSCALGASPATIERQVYCEHHFCRCMMAEELCQMGKVELALQAHHRKVHCRL